ncbi:MAG: amidohydrolase [Bacteroidia bacterium]|nr:MAG: amidohydrolase [Bacteroidia bacterium]
MKKTFLQITILLLITSFIYSQSSILIKNVTIHNGKGDKPFIANVLIKNQFIAKIQNSPITEKTDTIIDGTNLHLFPALISCNNILGLQEAEAIRPTSDYADIGDLNPHLRTLTSYNTDSKILPTVFSNGILYTQCTPRGGYIAGTSSVVKTKAWNWEDAVVIEDGIHIYIPSEYIQKGWWAEPDKTDKNEIFQQNFSKLKQFLQQSKEYYISKDTSTFNPRYESMRAIWNGTKNCYLHAQKGKDLLNAIQLAQEFQIPKVVLVGCKEIYKVIDIVKKYQYPIILSRINDLPSNTDDPIKINFELTSMLEKNGILYTISMEGDMEAMQSRNLPFVAGMSIPYGLTHEQALQCITLNAAKILGIDKQLGSIEEGKIASLILSKGNILDPVTHQIVSIILEGKIYSDKNFQNQLYERYLEKYHLKN